FVANQLIAMNPTEGIIISQQQVRNLLISGQAQVENFLRDIPVLKDDKDITDDDFKRTSYVIKLSEHEEWKGFHIVGSLRLVNNEEKIEAVFQVCAEVLLQENKVVPSIKYATIRYSQEVEHFKWEKL